MELWKTCENIGNNEKYLTTGCQKLDDGLRGGIARKGITQIFGEAGSGKTQWGLQLCLSVQIPETEGGCGAAAAYICTESVFPTKRLQQLLGSSEIVKKYGANGDKIFVEHVATINDLESCILQKIPRLISLHKIGLLVIDSIAAPYRAEYDNKLLKNRAKSLRSIGIQLHNLCRDYQLSAVCINQVSVAMGNKDLDRSCDGNIPTLGITWANLITNSFCLVKNEDCRYLYVRESPYLPRKSLPFQIKESGITGL